MRPLIELLTETTDRSAHFVRLLASDLSQRQLADIPSATMTGAGMLSKRMRRSCGNAV